LALLLFPFETFFPICEKMYLATPVASVVPKRPVFSLNVRVSLSALGLCWSPEGLIFPITPGPMYATQPFPSTSSVIGSGTPNKNRRCSFCALAFWISARAESCPKPRLSVTGSFPNGGTISLNFRLKKIVCPFLPAADHLRKITHSHSPYVVEISSLYPSQGAPFP